MTPFWFGLAPRYDAGVEWVIILLACFASLRGNRWPDLFAWPPLIFLPWAVAVNGWLLALLIRMRRRAVAERHRT